ncbi:MAG: hypothetical protein F6J89_20600 [Symploca sp. SIO1C4]|uniref:Uncharacterized protein n=1 Tax=Symploca sp. SIO1C4 TaxID=2607765 RepID=A0A6B3NL29_9CYAN|nr:hypothetical protein [Symploca sp. SIO1C4]
MTLSPPQQNNNQNKKGKRKNRLAKLVRKSLRNLSDLIDPEGKAQREEKVKALEKLKICVGKQDDVIKKSNQLKAKSNQLRAERERRRQERNRLIEQRNRELEQQRKNRALQKRGIQVAKFILSELVPLASVFPDIDLPDIDFPDIDFPDIDLPDIDFPDISSLSIEDFLEITDISNFLPDHINFGDLLDEIGGAFDTTDLEDLVDELNLDSIDLGELISIERQLDRTLDRLDEMLLELDKHTYPLYPGRKLGISGQRKTGSWVDGIFIEVKRN